MSELVGGKPYEGYSEENISAAANVALDSVPITTSTSMQWLFKIVDTTSNKYRTGKITVAHKLSVNPTYSVSQIVGDSISYQISVLLDAGNIKIYFQNNEAHTITCAVRRVAI